MGDTANDTWGPGDLYKHHVAEERAEQKRRDWELACVAAEFGYKACERGENIQMMIGNLAKIFAGQGPKG